MPDKDPVNLTIMKALLGAEGRFISGTRLAKQLGISRVSIWSRMEQLRGQGFEFEAATRKGYRIIKKPKHLNALLTRCYLEDGEAAPDLVFLNTIDSTNDHATRLLANDYEAPFIVISNQQTVGRGRMGRSWHSPPSSNLYMSLGSRPYVHPGRMQLFTLWMGVNVAQSLRDSLDLEIGLKWPNDLYYEGKKLGGMLTEARVDTDFLRELIFGIGLNVNHRPGDWPEALRQTATSLRELTGGELDLNRIAALLIKAIHTGYTTFLEGNVRQKFENLWPNFDILKGRNIEAKTREGAVQGIAAGLDNSGSLILESTGGKRVTLSAGEVHLKRG